MNGGEVRAGTLGAAGTTGRLGTGSATRLLDPAITTEVRDYLLDNPGPVTASAVATAVQHSGRVLGTAALVDLVARISAELSGAGPLQPLLDEPGVTDVFVNGPREVWVDRGAGLEEEVVFLGEESDVRALAVRLAASGGRRLDDGSPLVDVRLPGGARLNAVIPPLSGTGTVMSFRIPRARGFRLAELADAGFVPAQMRELLDEVLAVRANFLVSGGTGAGKTALLGAMLSEVSPEHRIVLVEDSAELVLDHPHVVALAARQSNVEGIGEVTMSDLVRNALRMRPDRLVVGECRGAEVRDMLTALNTGHEGGCATIHANTAESVPARLEALGALAGMSPEAVRAQTATAIDLVVHVSRTSAGRGIVHVSVPESRTDGRIRMHRVWDRGAGYAEDGLDRLQALLRERSES